MGGRQDGADARREIAGITVGSWTAMAPRLGLVVRRPWPGRAGYRIGRTAMLAVALGFDNGLAVVTGLQLRRWAVDESTVFAVAVANTRRAVGEAAKRRVGDGPLTVTAIAGGPFTSGAIVDLGPGAVAIPVSDELLVVVTPIGPIDHSALGAALTPLVAAATSTGGGEPGWPPVLQCRSDGRLAMFDPRSER